MQYSSAIMVYTQCMENFVLVFAQGSTNRRSILLAGTSILTLSKLISAKEKSNGEPKGMTRSEEQAAARQAAQMVFEETGEKLHEAAGELIKLPSQIPLINGSIFAANQHANRVLIIYFWSSWCPICKVLGPRLQEFWLAQRDKGISLLTIALQDSPTNIKKAIEQRRYQFPVALASSLKLPRQFKIKSMPTVMVRSKLGVIVTVEEGDLTAEELKEFLVHLS